MSRSHTRISRLSASALVCCCAMLGSDALGQGMSAGGIRRPPTGPVRFKSPADHQVFQRNANNRAQVPIVLPDDLKDYEIVDGFVRGSNDTIQLKESKTAALPPGGPYYLTVNVRLKPAPPPEADKDQAKDKPKAATQPLQPGMSGLRGMGMGMGMNQAETFMVNSGPFFVGDLWVLAGQSNMEGYGNLDDLTPPVDRVNVLGMNGKWARAEEPLHWLPESPDPVHSGDPVDREKRAEEFRRNRVKGSGLGLPFAVVLSGWTNIPIGLIPCAHGGTSMTQWDPAKKGEGGKSLYGSMIRQINLVGGKAKGILWYQGESDASNEAAPEFAKRFADFVAAVRNDLGQPDLPFYYVQIGRHVTPTPTQGWNIVQEAQRKAVDQIPNTAMISVIDLALDDGIHVGTQGLKRAGVRLARIAARELFGQAGAKSPTLDQITKGNGNTLLLRFKGVNRPTQTPYPTRLPSTGTLYDIPAYGNLSFILSTRTMTANNGAVIPNEPNTGPLAGLQPPHNIAGFSIRKADGTDLVLIYEAEVGINRETVVLKLNGPIPPGANLWYGFGRNPYCNLTDALDMAVPAFGPVSLDGVK